MIAHATERLEDWRRARRRTGRMLVALDYDGTLTPIVQRPEEAALSERTRSVLARLAERPDTDVAVVSGRALEDVRRRVGLSGLYYAGNHGLEIEGPGLHWVHAEASAARPRIESCGVALREALRTVPGVIIEDKGITLSVHYRLVVSESEATRVRTTVEEVCGGHDGVRITSGKKVLEVRPDMDWDKGRATRFLVHALNLAEMRQAPVLFIGDDRTDEDAFRELNGWGYGILVAEMPPPDTAATALLHTTEEVVELLAALAAPDEAS